MLPPPGHPTGCELAMPDTAHQTRPAMQDTATSGSDELSDSRLPANRRPAANKEGGAFAAKLFERLRHFFGKASMREEIEDALDQDNTVDDFSPEEKIILKNVLSIHDLRVADIMVPRADIIALPVSAMLSAVLDAFRTHAHSRLPVYGETLDDPLGMIHIRDFVDYLASAADRPALEDAAQSAQKADTGAPSAIAQDLASGSDGPPQNPFSHLNLATPLSKTNILRPVLYAPPSMAALDLLAKMRATRTHMALVIDEYGGTDGLVSIEDVVETIVGDIADEHDEEEGPMVLHSANGQLVADARAPLSEVSAALGIDLGALGAFEEIDTVGGLIGVLAGRVPLRGEIILGPHGLEFEILEADPRTIRRLKVIRTVQEGAPSAFSD